MLLQRGAINIIIYMIVEYEVRFFFVGIRGESIGLSCKTRKHFDKGVVAVWSGYMKPHAENKHHILTLEVYFSSFKPQKCCTRPSLFIKSFFLEQKHKQHNQIDKGW